MAMGRDESDRRATAAETADGMVRLPALLVSSAVGQSLRYQTCRLL